MKLTLVQNAKELFANSKSALQYMANLLCPKSVAWSVCHQCWSFWLQTQPLTERAHGRRYWHQCSIHSGNEHYWACGQLLCLSILNPDSTPLHIMDALCRPNRPQHVNFKCAWTEFQTTNSLQELNDPLSANCSTTANRICMHLVLDTIETSKLMTYTYEHCILDLWTPL